MSPDRNPSKPRRKRTTDVEISFVNGRNPHKGTPERSIGISITPPPGLEMTEEKVNDLLQFIQTAQRVKRKPH